MDIERYDFWNKDISKLKSLRKKGKELIRDVVRLRHEQLIFRLEYNGIASDVFSDKYFADNISSKLSELADVISAISFNAKNDLKVIN